MMFDTASLLCERLGLRLSPARDGRRTLHVGGPANLFCLHFLSDSGPDGPLAQPLRRALAATWSLFAVALGVKDLDAALGQLEIRGVRAMTFHHHTNDETALTPNNQGQRSRPAGPCQTGDESC